MATRVPDSTQTNIQMKSQRLVRKNTSFSIAGELESCASNDIPLQFESISEEETEELHREKSISKRKSAPSYKTQRRHNRVKKINTKSIQISNTCQAIITWFMFILQLQAKKKDMQQQTKKAKTTPIGFKMGNEQEVTSRKINRSS